MIHIGAGSLPALLAIGYFAIGLPLAHPFLHDQHGRPFGHAEQNGDVIQAFIVDAYQSDCLICQFLRASHLCASNPTPASATDAPAAYRLGEDPRSCGKPSTIQVISRGPPLCLCPPIA